MYSRYRRRPVEVHAMQWNGSTPNAYEILAWVTRNGGTGEYRSGWRDQGPDTLFIDGVQVTEKHFVVLDEHDEFNILSADDFGATFESIPDYE